MKGAFISNHQHTTKWESQATRSTSILGDKNVRREDFMRNGIHDHFVSVIGLVMKSKLPMY